MVFTIPGEFQQATLGYGLTKIPGILGQIMLIGLDLAKSSPTDITCSSGTTKVRDLLTQTDSLE